MLWSGISFEKVTVKHGDNEQEMVIAMTEEESRDKNYRDYLIAAQIEKTEDWLKKHPKIAPKEGSREHLGGMMREMTEYKARKKETLNKKYF